MEIKIFPIDSGIFDLPARARKVMAHRILDKSRGNGGIEYPAEGGILTYLVGDKYPIKGIKLVADETVVDVVDRVKRAFFNAMRFVFTPPIIFFLPIFLPFYKPIIISALRGFSNFSYSALYNFYFTENRWCKSGREIYRVLKKEIGWANWTEKQWLWWEERWKYDLVMTFMMIWEHIDGYRYKSQDIFGELNKEALKKNPRKELLRLMDLWIEREQAEGTKKKWRQFRKPISLLLWIFRGKVKKLAEVLAEIDIEKTKLDEQDYYHCLIRSNFNYKGQSFVERMKLRGKIDAE